MECSKLEAARMVTIVMSKAFGALSIFVQSGTCHGGNLKKKAKVCPEKRKNNDGNLRKCSKRGD